MAAMSDITEFLNAQYDKRAKAAADLKRWAVDGEFAKTLVDPVIGPFNGSTKRRDMGTGLDLITLADPDWVLADIESDRQIMRDHQPERAYVYQDDGTRACGTCGDGTVRWPCDTVRRLAAPFSGEPGYKEEWAI
jgi:hypothetical protein